jgi:hypothetical protein
MIFASMNWIGLMIFTKLIAMMPNDHVQYLIFQIIPAGYKTWGWGRP